MHNTPFGMNRQQRYEAIPQRDEVIILDSIHSSSYNYNTALPTSVASSSHGGPPSISTPNSPPPSFHTHSSPGTPRPSQSQLAGAQYAELWGVAPSTIGGDTINTSNDALATIAGLKRRVELLEESIGRLLLEKDSSVQNGGAYDSTHVHGNCCVSFTDASPDVEASLRNRQNCCVSYSGNSMSDAKRKEQRITLFALLFVAFLVCGTIAVVATARAPRVNRAVNKVVDEALKVME